MIPLIYLIIAFLVLLFLMYDVKDDKEITEHKDNPYYILTAACYILFAAIAWPITITLSLIVKFLKK
jgi:hypothetical protein